MLIAGTGGVVGGERGGVGGGYGVANEVGTAGGGQVDVADRTADLSLVGGEEQGGVLRDDVGGVEASDGVGLTDLPHVEANREAFEGGRFDDEAERRGFGLLGLERLVTGAERDAATSGAVV